MTINLKCFLHFSAGSSKTAAFRGVPGRFVHIKLRLKFEARPSHFWEGKMKLQCEAIISQAHTLRSEEIIITSNGATTATGAYGKCVIGKEHISSEFKSENFMKKPIDENSKIL
ncbi:c2-set_2 domain-containing protein [Caerostris extrusa]|uniref:C2-set_2 domain-containing protein n=1 Tax=Caerostris extrusa TaxID=172846 RepID=A0AAV4W4I2_CAEEX|nr:c2-set_2 domain-containing protein [Caerostris extrusa]